MNYTDEQMDEIAAMSQSAKRDLIDLLDRFGEARYWIGRYREGQSRGDSTMLLPQLNHHEDEATKLREQVKAMLFPNGDES